MNSINKTSTPAILRLLAKQIESGEAPAFCMCAITDDEKFNFAYNVNGYLYGLIGLIEQCKSDILADVWHEDNE